MAGTRPRPLNELHGADRYLYISESAVNERFADFLPAMAFLWVVKRSLSGRL